MTPARLVTVVIPALNEVEHVGAAVRAALAGYGDEEVEVIVVDGGSGDGTSAAVPARARVFSSAPGRAEQMNRGAAAARGRILVFCHADTRHPLGWREAVIAYLNRDGVAGGSFDPAFLPARGILHVLNRLRYPADWRLAYGDQAQFTHTATFRRVGGFPRIPLMEDIALARALSREGRLVRLRPRVETSSRRFLERGPLRHLVGSLWLTARYLYLGLSAEEVARRYRSSRERQAEVAVSARAD